MNSTANLYGRNKIYYCIGLNEPVGVDECI